jgi:hypothetical protein
MVKINLEVIISISFFMKFDKSRRTIILIGEELKVHKSRVGGELLQKKRRSDMKRKLSVLENRVEHVRNY